MTYHNVQTFMANRDAKSRAPRYRVSQGFDDWLEEVLTRETPERRVAALTACGRSHGGGGVSFSIRLRLALRAVAAVLSTYCARQSRASAVGASPLPRLDLGHCWWAKSLPRV
jgi:hypothetical protein